MTGIRCRQWIERHGEAWRDATRHPFLDACRDASIPEPAFHTWLVQDYRFVLSFTRFAARLLAGAPTGHMDVLIGGLAALGDELAWFRQKADERGLDLDVRTHPTCASYAAFMEALTETAYPVQATAFWAIERAYNQAWREAGPMRPPYDEFADRWGSEAFTAYVSALEAQADEALAAASDKERAAAESAFHEVARLEKDFWQMAFDAG